MKLQGIVYIHDYKGNPIHDTITSFSYKFSEEEDDVCEIIIESDDRSLADTPAYQEGRELTVQWGWSGGKMSKVRKVYIFNTYPEYGEQVKLRIECHEKFVIAKMDVAANRNETTLKRGTPLILSSNVLAALNLTLDKGNPELQNLLTENSIKVKDKKIQTKKYKGEKRIVSYFNGNTSTFQSLRTYLNKLPGGPYIIESRDDNVNIKTRDLAQASIRSWTYRGGNEELIEFKPEKKTRTSASKYNNIAVTSWDLDNMEAITQESTAADEGQIKLVNSQLIRDWHLFGTKDNKPQLQYAPTYGVPLNPETPEPATGILATQGGLGVNKNKKFVRVLNGYEWGGRPQNKTIFNINVARPIFQYLEDTAAPKDNMYSVEHDSERALAEADNSRKDAEAKAEKGSASMLGEPGIECGMIVSFDGVGKKDGGNYYIFSCTHTIGAQGYMLELDEIGRQGVNRESVQPPVKTINAINNPFPQFDPFGQSRNFDYGYKNKIAPHVLGLGATREKIVKEDETYINKSVGPIEQQDIKGIIPRIRKPD